MRDVILDLRLAYLFRASGNDRLCEDAMTRLHSLRVSGNRNVSRHATRAINFLEKVL